MILLSLITHFDDISSEKEPLCPIINGVAGTGKSYLINAIRNLLQSKCAVAATTDKHCKQATGYNDKVFGGKSLILTGDPGQLPTVADKPLYHARPSNAVGEQGHQAYHMFDKVVKLTVNQCDASNEQVANYNHDQLTKLEHPVAHINARHSSALAKKISSDMSGLESVVFLAKGARVMLTMNLWSSVGLCNGATGTVVDIIYQNNHQPPDLPIVVIVEFENHRGPVFNENQQLCIPIYPITVTSQTEIGFHERQQ
ncbi:Hypothetical predicted protein [Paramuricea clavata]|uniref:DNA helicase Pif1-like 2B domain-containing protein n=1 Tax=Paramuricea clavata TaxID=317549 RepID=A0A6S7HWZ8_PARCT|nr:Hypothetical predicted protein [Paramuricea clavata]